jgi:hypothetical protein
MRQNRSKSLYSNFHPENEIFRYTFLISKQPEFFDTTYKIIYLDAVYLKN